MYFNDNSILDILKFLYIIEMHYTSSTVECHEHGIYHTFTRTHGRIWLQKKRAMVKILNGRKIAGCVISVVVRVFRINYSLNITSRKI